MSGINLELRCIAGGFVPAASGGGQQTSFLGGSCISGGAGIYVVTFDVSLPNHYVLVTPFHATLPADAVVTGLNPVNAFINTFLANTGAATFFGFYLSRFLLPSQF